MKKLGKILEFIYYAFILIGGILFLAMMYCSLMDGTFGHLADV